MNEKKQIFIIGGLLIVLIIIWTIVLQPPKKNSQETSTSAEERGLEFKVMLEMVEELNNKENVKELSYEENKDPFSLRERSASGEGIITGLPPSITAAAELDVPKSIPITLAIFLLLPFKINP